MDKTLPTSGGFDSPDPSHLGLLGFDQRPCYRIVLATVCLMANPGSDPVGL